MFLIRMAFWIIIVILLLPTDSEQQTEVLGTAQAAFHDVSGFCDRNPDVCVKSADAFQVFWKKAEFGANMVMGFINERSADKVETPAVYEATDKPVILVDPLNENAIEAKGPQNNDPQNTLKPADLAPGWHAPATARQGA